MSVRTCRVCLIEKPMTAFAAYNREGGRRHECITCMNTRREKYQSGDWVSNARPREKHYNLRKIYAGPNHCWICRRSVKSNEQFALCKICGGIKWEKPE